MSAATSPLFLHVGLLTSACFVPKSSTDKQAAGSLQWKRKTRIHRRISASSTGDGSNYSSLERVDGLMLPKKSKKADTYLVTGTSHDSRFASNNMDDDRIFRSIFQVRSYETGSDMTVSINTVLNYLQESAVVWGREMGFTEGVGFARTQELSKQDLSWVVVKLQFEIDKYPTWGDVVQVESWMNKSGKKVLCLNSFFRDIKSDEILLRASRSFVLLNNKTRRRIKFPDEVQEGFERYQLDRSLNAHNENLKIPKLEEAAADYVYKGLTPKWSDIDFNNHVNNTKYANWILEGTPESLATSHKLVSLALEFRRECPPKTTITSFTTLKDSITESDEVHCQHLLQFEDGSEILRGATVWKPKGLLPINQKLDSIARTK
uniref:Acyl-[acyl-carrier-protein] hydrolase n=1 Tax=Kalanchoe fedtschenkoi TaxID=63787 RepID=A0A7N0U7K6_KALFE